MLTIKDFPQPIEIVDSEEALARFKELSHKLRDKVVRCTNTACCGIVTNIFSRALLRDEDVLIGTIDNIFPFYVSQEVLKSIAEKNNLEKLLKIRIKIKKSFFSGEIFYFDYINDPFDDEFPDGTCCPLTPLGMSEWDD
ncbi:MAG: hypothetical protein ACFFC7_14005 [Candidatus Hermodarchaeota archaeon]